ncbi:MAG TPA: hypothetical protein VHM70_21395 [Polyangiaceae bacterium]|nr:hypothetical protein [Polyangiaceae bacterium]
MALAVGLGSWSLSGCKDDGSKSASDAGAMSMPTSSTPTPGPTESTSTGPEQTTPTGTEPQPTLPQPSVPEPVHPDGDVPDAQVPNGSSMETGETSSPDLPTTDTTSDVPTTGSVDAGQSSSMADSGPAPCPAVPEFVEPTALSQTGLFTDIASDQLAPGVRQYRPRFELWSDGAKKRRFVYLPPCTQIDTSDPDYWIYPVGTKLWKEFTRDNADGQAVRVETRLYQKKSATKWFWTAFIWNDDQTDATVAESDGPAVYLVQENAKGTPHDVPGRKTCETCHYSMEDQILGFTALQLDFDSDPGLVDLQTLTDEGLITTPIPSHYVLPGTDEQQQALGYMHANCGECHNPWSKEGSLAMQYWLELDKLGSVEETPTYLTTVGQMVQAPQPPVDQPPIRVIPQDLDNSAVYWRMIQEPTFPATPRGGTHMPLVATEITDDNGVQLVADWINSLSPVEMSPAP